MTSLDDLFEQIIHTERRAQERRNFLTEIKTKVQNLKDQIQNAEEECVCLKGQLASKVQQLNDDELSEKLLQNKEKTMSEQLDILKKEKEIIENKITETLDRKGNETECFCKEVEDFMSDYSLISNGSSTREQQANQTLVTLKQRYDMLKQVSDDYNEKQGRVKELQDKQEELLNEKMILQGQLNDLDKQLETEKQKTMEQERLLDSPSSNPEFIKLQNLLGSFKNENLEEECKALQQEVWRLQQLHWQKQVKQRQKQQDMKRQTSRQQCTPEPVMSNRVQMSNFPTENKKQEMDDATTSELQDVFNDDFSQDQQRKFLFKKKQ